MSNHNKPPVVLQQQRPSVDDIIDWNLEHATYLGESGYTTDFPTLESLNFQPSANTDSNEDVMLRDSDWPDILQNAVEDLTSDYNRVKSQTEYLKANRNDLTDTQLEVHRRLLAAGRTQRDVDRIKAEKSSLRRRIVGLHELENGTGKQSEKAISGWICYGAESDRRNAQINLDPKGSLTQFERCAKVYMECLKGPFVRLQEIYHEDRCWKYRLRPVVESKMVREDFFELQTERDYEHMVRSALGHSGLLLLTQEDWLDSPISTPEGSSQKKKMDETQKPLPQGVDSLFEDVDLIRDLGKLATGEYKFADDAALDELAAEARALAETEEAMEVARARHDQVRIAHNDARRVQRVEIQAREYGQGRQTQANDLAFAANRAGSPLRRSQRVAAQAPEGRSNLQNTSPPRATPAAERGGGDAENMSAPISRTRSGRQYD